MPRLFGGYWFGVNNGRIEVNLARLGLCGQHDNGLQVVRRVVDVIISETGRDNDFNYTGYSVADFDVISKRWPAKEQEAWQTWIESDEIQDYFLSQLKHVRYAVPGYAWAQPQPRLYSGLRQRIMDLPFETAEASQWLSTLENSAKHGVSGSEMEWSGLASWLGQQRGTLSRDAVLNHLHDFRYAIHLCQQTSEAFEPLVTFEETCKLIKNPRHPLCYMGQGRSVVRYRNRSHGFQVVMDKRATLFRDNIVWVLLDHRNHLIRDHKHMPWVFDDPQSAMQYAKNVASKMPQVKGTRKAQSKWSEYALPGGKDYTEWLLMLPNFAKSYFSGHFPVRNLLAHIRTTERSDMDERRLLFIEELQSDWNQDGRLYGFQSENNPEGEVPLNPYHLCWHETALKAMLIHAAQKGFDGLAWAPARIHQERFPGATAAGLEKFYDDILPKAVKRLCKNWGAPVAETKIMTRSRDYAIRQKGRNWRIVKFGSGKPESGPLESKEVAEKLLEHYRREVEEAVPAVFMSDRMRVELKDRGLPVLGSYRRGDPAECCTP